MPLEYFIIAALLLDFMVGDPRWLPHPVRFIGGLATGAETICRRFLGNGRFAGAVAVFFVLAGTLLAGLSLLSGARVLHPAAGMVVSVVILYFCFAAKDLADHSRAVLAALLAGDLPAARKKVAMIVGRDTERLSEEEIVKASVESVAENMVDGVTAPLFYAVVGGPLGALLYKAANTLDSIFGYKNERYRYFGWAAARLDDLLNFLPARLTGMMIVLAVFLLGYNGRQSWKIFRRDRLQHASPNSGHSEAAVAGALGLQLGGPNSYFGKMVEKPLIGDHKTAPQAFHITQVNRLLFMTTVLSAVILLALRLVLLP